jgi:membrane-bound ClpP family serine protease
LRAVFGPNIRTIVPQLAMSGGTMIALSSSEIVMGKHSCIGPIDPQVGGMPAHGVIQEFDDAVADVTKNPKAAAIWQPIIAKYTPTLIGNCKKAKTWAEKLAHDYLTSNMFKGEQDPSAAAMKVVDALGDHSTTLSHARHIDPAQAKSLGLKISDLESDQKLQDLVLTVHHACCHTFSGGHAVKIIENHLGIAVIDTCVVRASV